MKKFKKTAAVALAAIMAVGSMSVVAFADSATTEQQNKERDVNLAQGEIFVVDNVKYTANYNGSSLNGLEVCGLADDSVPAEITIPSEIDGIEVFSIADEAFKNCSNLKSVTIPGGIIMHDSAFEGCTALATVNILDYSGDDIWNIYGISESAFKNCISLKSVKIGTGINYIDFGAFEGCSALVSIDLPQSIDTIYHAAFRGCTSLSTITIPNAVKRIYSSTFENCSNLTKINIGSGVTEIHLGRTTGGYVDVDEYCTGGCFEGCTSLAEINVDPENKNFSSEDGVLFCGTQLCKFPPAKSGAYVVPDWVTFISGTGTLLGGYNHRAFENCRYITSITINAGGGTADYFEDCTSLKEINVDPDNERYFSDNGVLYAVGKSGSSLMAYPVAKPDKSYTVSQYTNLIASPLSPNLTSITIDCYY
ncbi:MAG: leucine-rich repeat domain-containing protein, partial [Oscillospiraceae bacterium]|nr:leucine-rich repeat domain-containing protein [Oscillospiraceae bacterium]